MGVTLKLGGKVLANVLGLGLGLAVVSLVAVPVVNNLSLLKEPGSLSTPIQLKPIPVPSIIYASDGSQLYLIGDGQYRAQLKISDIPKVVVKAVLDVEDHAFYLHGALDFKSIFRALAADASHGGGLQGGSTITQQLIKNAVLTPQRTLSRKFHEAILAYRIEGQLSKNEILQRYLNTIYFGEGAYGIQSAAYTYFNKPVQQLDVSQAALLAILIEDPNGLDPFLHPNASLYRRNLALDQMHQYGDLSASALIQARKEVLPTTSYRTLLASPGPFVAEVISRLETEPRFKVLGATPQKRFDNLAGGGYQIYTTLNPALQADAQAAVQRQIPNTNGKFAAALVSMDPSTGDVRALVPGNPNYSFGGFDVVTGTGSSGRQAGSSFKLFTLLAALQRGYSPYDTIDGTAPCTFVIPNITLPGHPYVARNAEQGYGVMTLTQATADSVNCAYIRLGVKVGLGNVVNMARLLGVRSPLTPLPSMIIGSEDINPLEMAASYATIDDQGIYHSPQFITQVVGENGVQLVGPKESARRVVSSQNARVAISVLRSVIEYGTGTGASIGRPAAGKTGTTDNFTDAWFDGFTPQLVTVVWMGAPAGSISMFDVGGIPVYGGTYPARIWRDFMSHALAHVPVENFPPPNYSLIPGGKFLTPVDSPGSISYPPAPTTTTLATTTTTTSTTLATTTSTTSVPTSAVSNTLGTPPTN